MRKNSKKLTELPGHQIRRLHQIAVSIFLQNTEAFGITPVQYAALRALATQGAMDQRSLAGNVGLDASTLGGVIDRLEARGVLQRRASPEDKRIKVVDLNQVGHDLLGEMEPTLKKSQVRILQPLTPAQRVDFMAMLNQLVEANNQHSRAPMPNTMLNSLK